MIRSMTGYGQAVVKSPLGKWTVEVRSLNHRYLEYSSKLPQSLMSMEGEIKNVVQSKIKRGKITLALAVEENEPGRARVFIDEEKLFFYRQQLKKIARKMKVEDTVSIRDLITLPGVFDAEREEPDSAKIWPRVKACVVRALEELVRMKIREGKALKQELALRLGHLQVSLSKIKTFAAGSVSHYQERLKNRIAELTQGLELDPDKLAKEAALLADRSDVTEEIVRLGSHIDLFGSVLEEDGEIGKKLDFITQEMNREANTIASKAMNFDISQEAVRIKTEIEKIREQVQNVE
ncbi:MAG: YicC family protein [Candidatus Omnitrophica bacterium]|nr:YicC family protein [Candidatus Omnitrophota bacterium]